MALTKKQRAELRMKFGGVGVSLEINGMPTTLSLSFVLMEICFTRNVTIYQTWFQHVTHAICTNIAVAWKITGELSVMVVVNSLYPGKAKRWFVWDWLK